MTQTFKVAASVGTMHYPFDRFVRWLEPWTLKNRAEVVFQHGFTRPMKDSENHTMLAPGELLEHYRTADAIVLQGGAGGLMDARKAGRIPIVVPRAPARREHVDDHQLVMCRKLADEGHVYVAESAEDLTVLLDGVRAGTISTRVKSQRPTPGVHHAVRRLASGPRRERRIERGALTLVAPMRSPRRTAHAVALRVVHRGLLSHALALAVAVLLSRRLDLSVTYAAVTIGAVALGLVGSLAYLPPYDRARSARPALSLIFLAGVGLMGALLAGMNDSTRLRQSLGVVLAAAVTLGAGAIAHRLLFRRTPTVLVGDEPAVRRLAIRWARSRDVKVVASCAWRSGSKPDIPDESLSELVPEVMAAVARNNARSVVIASERSLASPTLRDLSMALRRMGVDGVVLADGGDDRLQQVRPRAVAGQVGLETRPVAENRFSDVVKAIVDRVGAALGLVVLSPLLVVVGLAVRLTSRRPAILRQARTGRDGRSFVMNTFRTEESSKLGRFLRRTSMDELPRLYNVLKGDMSLVGPRPSPPSETVRYDDRRWRRLRVRPGMTGLCQVSGRSTLLPAEQTRIDLQYVDHWNLRLDARILLRTLRVALNRDVAR